MQIMNISFPG